MKHLVVPFKPNFTQVSYPILFW